MSAVVLSSTPENAKSHVSVTSVPRCSATANVEFRRNEVPGSHVMSALWTPRTYMPPPVVPVQRAGKHDAARSGEHERQLTDVPELISGYPRWSPDGARIAFHASSLNDVRAVYSVVVATGATQRLFDGCCPGGWSADGESLYVTNEGTVQRIAVADGRRETLFRGETATESTDGR